MSQETFVAVLCEKSENMVKPTSSLDSLKKLEKECDRLRHQLGDRENLQQELESIKEELEKVLETHRTLQKVAMALEEKNRTLQEQYKNEAREKMRLDEQRLDLENEVESRRLSYEGLEKRFMKIKEKLSTSEELEDMVYSLEKEKRKGHEKIQDLQQDIESKGTFEFLNFLF